MNTTLWIIQSLIALTFLYSGINKSIFSEEKLVASGQTGVEGLQMPLIRFIGVVEILGAIGTAAQEGLGLIKPDIAAIEAGGRVRETWEV